MSKKLVKLASILILTGLLSTSSNAQLAKTIGSYVYNLDTVLVDPLATPTTQNLYRYMLSQYGNRIISGQTDGNYIDVVTLTGKHPLIYNTDFQHYTQGYSYIWTGIQPNPFTFGWDDNGNTERAINWYNSTNKKGIVSFQWHWHSPSGGTAGQNTFNRSSTTFNPALAVTTTTSEYFLVLRDIDSIATQIRKLSNANVPILFRPLHEASGSGANDGSGAWFWWGGRGNVVFKKLYNIIFDRLVNHHGLHNIIWVMGTPESSWYPGNTKVDVMGGIDSYAGLGHYQTQKSWFNVIYNTSGGKKMLTMPENGPIPDPNWCLDSAVTWSYFMTWNDSYTVSNSAQHVKDVYSNPRVVTVENRDLSFSTLPGYMLITPSSATVCPGFFGQFQVTNTGININWYSTTNQLVGSGVQFSTSIAGIYYAVFSATGLGVITTTGASLSTISLPTVSGTTSFSVPVTLASYELSATPSSGLWSGSGVVGNTFVATIAGKGISNLSYSSTFSGCFLPLYTITASVFTVTSAPVQTTTSGVTIISGSSTITGNVTITSTITVVNGNTITGITVFIGNNDGSVQTIPGLSTTVLGINTAILNAYNNQTWEVYPNPSEGRFTISNKQGLSSSVEVYERPWAVEVFNTTGILIANLGLGEHTLPKGLYLLRNGKELKKLLIE